MTPPTGSPPIHSATRMTTPIATVNPGRNHFDLGISIEHLLLRSPEEPCEREGERQGRGVALLLDRVDRLPRDVHRLGELPLRETELGPQLPDQVPHRVKRT